MSNALSRGLPGAVLALLGLACCSVLATAQTGDPLKQVSEQKQIAAKKFEQEVTAALKRVRELEKKDRSEALAILSTYKGLVEHNMDLTAERRKELVNYLSQLIRQLRDAGVAEAKTRPTPKSSAYDDEFKKFQQAGAKKPSSSSGVAGTASTTIGGLAGALNKSKGATGNKEKFFNQAIDVSSGLENVPTGTKALAFDPGYKLRKKIRDKFSGFRLTEEEAKLLKALNSVMKPDFDKATFRDVIKYLQEHAHLAIAVDPNSLKEANVEYDTLITFQDANKLSVRTILRKVLGDLNLAYILKDGIVQVVTPQIARETLTTKTYPIGDLLPVGDPRFGPAYNMARDQYFANEIMQMIVTTVEPASWAANGGRGTIFYSPTTRSVVIRNSAELHLSVAAGIYR
jgi:hypothetical protein